MNWDDALRFLQPLRGSQPEPASAGEHKLVPASAGEHKRVPASAGAHPRPSDDPHGAHPLHRTHAPSLCIASGKGGTGKSVVCAGLASLWAEHARTLVVDADLGVGNAHLMHNVQPALTLVDVVRGRASSTQALTVCSPKLELLAGGSGVSQMASLTPVELARIAGGIESLDARYEMILVDSAAGISDQTIAFAAASDAVLIVTTPDPTAMTDAYAFLKVLLSRRRDAHVDLLINRTVDANEGPRTAERIERVCQRFLGRGVGYAGALPDDRSVVAAVAQRMPVSVAAPHSPAAVALRELHHRLAEELAALPHLGVGRTLAAGCATVLPRD